MTDRSGRSSRKTKAVIQKLGEFGLRSTKARVLILLYLSDRHDHPTAEAMLQELRQQGKHPGLATLYQNLSKLADSGLISRLNGSDGLMHFDGNVGPHPHLSCVRCGLMVDAAVDQAVLREFRPQDPHSDRPLNDWQLEEVRLELKGVCPACLNKK